MFHMMLQTMEQQTAAVLKEKKSARALWYNEWAKLSLRGYEPDRTVIYTSAYAFPLEILAAFDVVPFDFELASGLIGTTPMAVPTMIEAENRGYSPDLCSFHRASLGAFYNNYFPKPDMLITTSHYCDGKSKTNEILSLLSKKDSSLLYVPCEITKESVSYVQKQLREIALKVGQVAGQKLDHDRLKEAVRNSNKARKSQLELSQLLKHCPAPWGGGQLVSFSINSLLFTGSEVLDQINQALLRELEGRIEKGKLRPERHRLYWFAWIPTHGANLFDILKANEVSVPMCETFRMYWDEIDEDNPFEGLALKCLTNPFVGPASRRIEGLERVRDEYSIDGAILFATPACRHANSTCRLLKDSLAALGIPFLMLDIDIGDPRGFSPERTRTQLESFIEVMDQGGAVA